MGRSIALVLLVLMLAVPARAQQSYPLPPLPPAAGPPTVLGPADQGSPDQVPPDQAAPDQIPPDRILPDQPPAGGGGGDQQPAGQQSGRSFCEQTVSYRLADRASVAEPYRGFIGVWSDAAWDARTCAALIVENVRSDGTATIVYVYGPNGSSSRVPAATLHGTGIIRDGELQFQNSDGTQYAFRRLLADLSGRLTTPAGQVYRTVFKATP